MTLLGLPLTQLAMVFGAAGVAVVLLYILRLRRRRVMVPFARLWSRVLQEKESTRLLHRLKRLLSLLLQLLLLFLLTAALGDPRLSDEVLRGRHIILLLDASASMRAADETDGATRLQAGVQRAKELIRGMGGADQMMLVRMDREVTPLGPFSSDERALLRSLQDLSASDTGADLPRALKFCADALSGRQSPLLILITDGAFPTRVLSDSVLLGEKAGGSPPPLPAATSPAGKTARGKPSAGLDRALDRVDLRGIKVRHVAVGRSGDNVGIVAFNARRYPRNKLSFEMFLEVVSFLGKDTEVDLQLFADRQLIDVQRLPLKAGQRSRFSCDPEDRSSRKKTWCSLAASGALLEAQLASPGRAAAGGRNVRTLDPFSLDDRAFAMLPRREKQQVLLVSRGSLYLEAALLDDSLEVTRVQPEKYTAALARRADAIIFDHFFPETSPPRSFLVIDPPAAHSPFHITGRINAPLVTEQDQGHPVMRWVTFKDLNISSASRFAKGEGTRVLAASFREPVMVARQERSRRSVALGFDLVRSDLPLRVAFPLLVINALDWFSGESQSLVASFRTGESWSVPLPPGPPGTPLPTAVRVRTPDGRLFSAPVHEGRAILGGQRAGIYTLEHQGSTMQVAANLADPDESDIRPVHPLVLGGQTLQPPSGFGLSLRREIWVYLLLAALALAVVEWLTYNRRITV